MNSKGFTLIELLVTITLITVISVAAGVGISEMFNRQREKNYDEFVKTITNAGCTYAEVNNIYPDDTGSDTVKISDLISEGYLSKKLTDPMTKASISSIDNDYIVLIEISGYERVCSLIKK